MEKSYIVYKHTFPNSKIYIGITSLKASERWHCGGGYNNQPIMKRAIQKYGWNNIKHEILFENLTKEQAEQKEIELIAFYKSNKKQFGYNIANGGNCAGTLSDATKERLRQINLNKKIDKTTCAKISERLKGKPKSLQHRENISKAKKGKKLSEEAKQKIRLKHIGLKWNADHWEKIANRPSPLKGIRMSDETRHKMSIAAKGRVISEEAKRKISIKNSGCNNPMYNKKHTPEAIQKILASVKRKKVLCIETGIEYKSIIDCSKQTNISETAISNTCKGKRKQAKGLHFRFI